MEMVHHIRTIKAFPQNGGMFFWGKCISNNNWPYIYTYPYCPTQWFRPGYNNRIDWSNPQPMFQAMDMVCKRSDLFRRGCHMHRQHNDNFCSAHTDCPRIRRFLRIRYMHWRQNRMNPNQLWSVYMFLGCKGWAALYRHHCWSIYCRDIPNLASTFRHGCFHRHRCNSPVPPDG